MQPTSGRTEVASDVLDAHAQRHQIEDGDGEPRIPRPGVDAGAPPAHARPAGGAGEHRNRTSGLGGKGRHGDRVKEKRKGKTWSEAPRCSFTSFLHDSQRLPFASLVY